jgi:hypothetical protein
MAVRQVDRLLALTPDEQADEGNHRLVPTSGLETLNQ